MLIVEPALIRLKVVTVAVKNILQLEYSYYWLPGRHIPYPLIAR